jgi:LacI family transcriptional regulator
MIKLTDVAEKAGVSTATASLVFNNRPGVNKETRENVIRAARELGYMPNNVARSLAMKKSQTIGLVVTDIENPFFGSLTRYIDEATHQNNYSLILAVSRDDPELENQILQKFIGERVDGILVVPTQLARAEFRIYELLAKRGVPFVFATTFYPGYDGDYVMTDLEQGSYRLTRYLLELGHRDIVFLVSSDLRSPISDLRISGFKRAFAEFSLEVEGESIVQCQRPDFQSGYGATKGILEKRQPDAVIAINDVLALGVLKAIKEVGLRVPDDISVAGYDGVIFSSIADVPLTTVRQNVSEIARLAVQLLIRKISDASPQEGRVLIPPELMVRDSTGPKPRRAP